MRDMRPVLLGMNNPLSERPEAALFPHPPGSSGWRLWQMLAAYRPEINRHRFVKTFDRRNLLDSTLWDDALAFEMADEVWQELRGRQVVVFGVKTLECLSLPHTPETRRPILMWTYDRDVQYCWAPHPSGLTHWYNNPICRAAVGFRLESLYDEYLARYTRG